MWEKQIACMTYNKYPKEDWSEEEFSQCEVNPSSTNNSKKAYKNN